MIYVISYHIISYHIIGLRLFFVWFVFLFYLGHIDDETIEHDSTDADTDVNMDTDTDTDMDTDSVAATTQSYLGLCLSLHERCGNGRTRLTHVKAPFQTILCLHMHRNIDVV